MLRCARLGWVGLLLGIFGMLSISGCSSIVGYGRTYGGSARPLENVALLTHVNPYSQTILLTSIDGAQKTSNGEHVVLDGLVELTPGSHAVCAAFIKSGAGSSYRHSKGCATVRFKALPGHVYVIYEAVNTHQSRWQPRIRDITDELAAPEMADLAAKLDAILQKNRPGATTGSVTGLAAGRPAAPLKGFGETMHSDLSPWLKQPVTVTYEFYRYRPFFTAEASDGQTYHLEVDPYSGKVRDVFGRQVDVGGKWEVRPAFQPLGADVAVVSDNNGDIKASYRQLPDGAYRPERNRRYATLDNFQYSAMIKTEWLEGLPSRAVSALVLAHNAAPARLAEYGAVQKEIAGLEKQRAIFLLRKKAFVLALAALDRADEAIAKAKPGQKTLLQRNRTRCERFFTVLLRDDNLVDMPVIACTDARVRFFATGYEMLPVNDRRYQSVLSRQDTTFVGWQLDLAMPAPGKKINYLVKALWFAPDGRLLTHQSMNATCQADWTRPWHAASWGYRKAGNWVPGDYRVAFFINGRPAAESHFTIR